MKLRCYEKHVVHAEQRKFLRHQEGVGMALRADGGCDAVAGVDDGVVGEFKEFGADRVHDIFHGAAPEIGAANASSEERVAGE